MTTNIYIIYNLKNSLSKDFVDMFIKSQNCSLIGCRNSEDSTLYLNFKYILGNDDYKYYNKYYNKMNIIYFGEENLPIKSEKYIMSYIYFNCENYSEELKEKIGEYLEINTDSMTCKIRKLVNKFNLDYLICYTASNLFVYDKSKSIYIYSDVNNFEILTENNLKYFKENKYNLIPQEQVNKFLII